jgi:hypothetical protein
VLAEQLSEALTLGRLDVLPTSEPVDRRDRFRTLQQIYALHLAPISQLGHRVVLQHDPTIATLKQRLESAWVHELDTASPVDRELTTPEEVREALLDIAVEDRLPATYKWLAKEASWEELVHFLAVEGGPDGGFDDLVALCQVGLAGEPKLELARNYWDEMGNGSLDAVHTVLHDDLVAAAGMPRIPEDEQTEEALERAALNGLLATNRYLQPEFVGSLGMTELQAGPRCRLVVQALERLGAPAGTFPFYREHAEVDPRHGADWVENAVKPLVAADPFWGRRIVRGASWRAATNLAFFRTVQTPASLAA